MSPMLLHCWAHLQNKTIEFLCKFETCQKIPDAFPSNLRTHMFPSRCAGRAPPGWTWGSQCLRCRYLNFRSVYLFHRWHSLGFPLQGICNPGLLTPDGKVLKIFVLWYSQDKGYIVKRCPPCQGTGSPTCFWHTRAASHTAASDPVE